MAQTRAQWLLNEEEAIVTDPAQKMAERLGDEIARQMAKLRDQLTQVKQSLSAVMETRGLTPSPNQASTSLNRSLSRTLQFQSHLELPSSHHLEPGGGRSSPISTNQPIPEKIEDPSLKRSSTAVKSNRLVPLKYSGEEVWERMGNGLCIFCEEKDSPEHQLKHKRLRIVVMECDNHDQPLDENELVDTVIDAPSALLMTNEEDTKESVEDVGVAELIYADASCTEIEAKPEVLHQIKAFKTKVSNSLLEPDHTIEDLQSGLCAKYCSLDDFSAVVSSSLSCVKRVGTAELQACISSQAIHVWEPGGLVYSEIQTRWLEKVDTIGTLKHCVTDIQMWYVSVSKASIGIEFCELEYRKLYFDHCFEAQRHCCLVGPMHLAFDPGGIPICAASGNDNWERCGNVVAENKSSVSAEAKGEENATTGQPNLDADAEAIQGKHILTRQKKKKWPTFWRFKFRASQTVLLEEDAVGAVEELQVEEDAVRSIKGITGQRLVEILFEVDRLKRFSQEHGRSKQNKLIKDWRFKFKGRMMLLFEAYAYLQRCSLHQKRKKRKGCKSWKFKSRMAFELFVLMHLLSKTRPAVRSYVVRYGVEVLQELSLCGLSVFEPLDLEVKVF